MLHSEEPTPFSPTATSSAPARCAATKMPTVISANAAAHPQSRSIDQSPQCIKRCRARKKKNKTLVPSFTELGTLAQRMDTGRTQRMEEQRVRSMQKLAGKRPANSCHDPRQQLGRKSAFTQYRRQSIVCMV